MVDFNPAAAEQGEVPATRASVNGKRKGGDDFYFRSSNMDEAYACYFIHYHICVAVDGSHVDAIDRAESKTESDREKTFINITGIFVTEAS